MEREDARKSERGVERERERMRENGGWPGGKKLQIEFKFLPRIFAKKIISPKKNCFLQWGCRDISWQKREKEKITGKNRFFPLQQTILISLLLFNVDQIVLLAQVYLSNHLGNLFCYSFVLHYFKLKAIQT